MLMVKTKRSFGRLFATGALAGATLVALPGMAFGAPVSGSGSVKVNGLTDGDVVTAYQVATADLGTDGTVTYTWVDPVDDVDGIIDLNSGNDLSTAIDQELANDIALAASSFEAAGTSDEAASGTASIDALPAGVYVIKVTNDDDSTRVYQNMILSVKPVDSNSNGSFDSEDVFDGSEVTLKVSTTGLEKVVKEGDADYGHYINTLSFGDTTDFKITVTVPTYADYKGRIFTVTDQLDDAYFDLGSLTADDVTIAGLERTTDYSVAYENGLIKVTFTPAGLQKAAAAVKVDITYSVKVDATAAAVDAVLNGATLTFDKDSVTEDYTGTVTDEDTADFYALQIVKKGSDDALLPGAEFEITFPDGSKKTVTSGENGLTDLVAALGSNDEITITETKAPAGYKPAATTEWTVNVSQANEDNVISLEIVNTKDNTVLPTTGGTGTVALTAAGVVLIAGAAMFIVRSRKEN